MSQFDLFAEGAALRDAGLAQTEAGQEDWFENALMFVAYLPHGWEGPSEDFRPLIRAKYGAPRSHKSWGSVTMHAKRRGYLIEIGTTYMKDPRAHKKSTPLYRRP